MLSDDNQYLIYSDVSNVLVRSTRSLATYKIISSPGRGHVQLVISRDNKYLALAYDTENYVRVICLKDDKEARVVQSPIEKISKIEWLDVDLHNNSGGILAVYSDNGLSVKIYSFVGTQMECIHTIYKYSSHIIRHSLHGHFAIVLKDGIKNMIFTFIVANNQVQTINNLELKDTTSDIIMKYSPQNSWILVSDSVSSELNIHIYNFLALGKSPRNDISSGYSFQKLISPVATLGVTCIDWTLNDGGDEIIVCGDHDESLHLISVQGALKIYKTLKHKAIQNEIDSTKVFDYNHQNLCYIEKSTPFFKLPSVDKISILNKGIDKIKINDTKIMSTPRSMPTVVFLWDLQKLAAPTHIINTPGRVVNFEFGATKIPRSNNKYVNSIIDNLVLINSGSSITLYCDVNMEVPQIVDTEFESKIEGAHITDLSTENGIIMLKLACWSKDEMCFIRQSLSPLENDQSKSRKSSGLWPQRLISSPMIEETDTKVRDLVNGVQQREWLVEPQEMSDTFSGKRRRIGKENQGI